MSQYVVGYVDWFNHDLVLEKIEANSFVEAIKKHPQVAEVDWGNATTVEEMKSIAFDCDSMVAVIGIEP